VKDFLISYTTADQAWAEWIAWHLEEAGYSTVLQAWDFLPGSNFVVEMDEATIWTERTILVLSERYLVSEFAKAEWAARFREDPVGQGRRIIPVRIEACEVKGLLGPIVYIDLVGLDPEAAVAAMLDGITDGRRKPTGTPEFPGGVARSVPEQPRFPGSLPPIWNLPHRRNPNFTGRHELLTSLHDALFSGTPAALTQAISGLGGVGKTQLATEYAYRHAADYDLVWWVRSEEPATLASDYAGLAEALGLSEKGLADQSVVVEAVRAALERRWRWLLVFDNATEEKDLRSFLPRSATGHVLITSRNPNWRGVATPLSVRPMPAPEAVSFIAKRTGGTEEEAAGSLAEAVGYLPLALEQACAHMEETGTDATHYLDLFHQRRRELLARGSGSSEYPDTVATTWELSFEKVARSCPAGAELLSSLAFLAPESIPLDLLRGLPDALADPIVLDDALAALRRYSLLEVSQSSASMHRLVQAVARDRLDSEAYRSTAEAVLALLNDAFPFEVDDPRTWDPSARLLPHALAAAGYAQALDPVPEGAGGLLNRAGIYLWRRAQFAGAKVALERALAIGEAIYGPDHPAVAAYVNNLGLALRDFGDLLAAKAAFDRALAIDEATYGPDHPTLARDMNNLGLVLRDAGDLAGAKAVLNRALHICERALGDSHPSTAMVRENLATLVRSSGPPSSPKRRRRPFRRQPSA